MHAARPALKESCIKDYLCAVAVSYELEVSEYF